MTCQKDYLFEKKSKWLSYLNFDSLISYVVLFNVYVYKQFQIVIRAAVLKAAWSSCYGLPATLKYQAIAAMS